MSSWNQRLSKLTGFSRVASGYQVFGVEIRQGTRVYRSMTAEIFARSLETIYTIFHISFVSGWSLILLYLFSVKTDDVPFDCPDNPVIIYYVHGVGLLSALGVLLWIFGRCSCCDQSKKHQKPTEKSIQNDALSVADIQTPLDDVTDDGQVLLIVNRPGKKFHTTISRFIGLAFFLSHSIATLAGTAVTIPMFFRYKLFSYGMDPSVCNEVLFWFAFMMLLVEYLMFFTLFSWFITEILVLRKASSRGLSDVEDATFESN